MTDPAYDSRLRREADRWLTVRTHDGNRPIRWDELEEFEFDGEPFKLMDRQRGIRKPRQLTAALSIRTTWTPPGRPRPYEDGVGPDGLIRYKFYPTRASSVGPSIPRPMARRRPDHAENRALRAAVAEESPLIWFHAVTEDVYQPIYPVFVLDEQPAQQQFVIAPDSVRGFVVPGVPVPENVRRYALRQTRQRLHQPVFRATVLHTYATRCAVCSLGHAQLLDAAHIVADSEDGGIASVRNGLALCKIHHTAYDVGVLGINPELVVEIRSDILAEIDGPMLEHGLKRRHGERLMALPRTKAEQPDVALLAQRYAAFRSRTA